ARPGSSSPKRREGEPSSPSFSLSAPPGDAPASPPPRRPGPRPAGRGAGRCGNSRCTNRGGPRSPSRPRSRAARRSRPAHRPRSRPLPDSGTGRGFARRCVRCRTAGSRSGGRGSGRSSSILRGKGFVLRSPDIDPGRASRPIPLRRQRAWVGRPIPGGALRVSVEALPRRSSSARASWAMRAPPTWTTSPRSIRSARCFARSLVMTRLSVLVLGFLASCDGLRLILRSPSRPGATRTSSGGLADQACDREPQTLFVVCPVLDPPERDEYFSRARYAKPAVGGERVREHEVVRPDDMPGRPLEARVGVRVVDGDALLVLTCQDDVSEQLDRPALDAEALHCLIAS